MGLTPNDLFKIRLDSVPSYPNSLPVSCLVTTRRFGYNLFEQNTVLSIFGTVYQFVLYYLYCDYRIRC